MPVVIRESGHPSAGHGWDTGRDAVEGCLRDIMCVRVGSRAGGMGHGGGGCGWWDVVQLSRWAVVQVI